MKFKYIVFEDPYGLETPVIFPEWVDHGNVRMGGKVISAGFVTFIGTSTPANTITTSNLIEAHCGGESVGLRVKSRPEDSLLIEKLIKRSWGT